MARVRVTRTWPDGDSLTVSIDAGEGYPDGLDQARATARRLYAEALGLTVESFGDDDVA